jgi:hypothetical protein
MTRWGPRSLPVATVADSRRHAAGPAAALRKSMLSVIRLLAPPGRQPAGATSTPCRERSRPGQAAHCRNGQNGRSLGSETAQAGRGISLRGQERRSRARTGTITGYERRGPTRPPGRMVPAAPPRHADHRPPSRHDRRPRRRPRGQPRALKTCASSTTRPRASGPRPGPVSREETGIMRSQEQ